jgi:putative endonuclease
MQKNNKSVYTTNLGSLGGQRGHVKPKPVFYVYILECNDKSYYTGYTNDLKKRIERHNRGQASKYTRSRLPVRLVWEKRLKNKSYAMKTEIGIKRLSRREKERLIAGSRLDNLLKKYAK